MRISTGYTDTNNIKKALDVICKMNSFISWFAEGRKQIEDYRKKFTQITFADYCKAKSIEIPQPPTKQEEVETTEEDIINKMSIKERQNIFSLKQKAQLLLTSNLRLNKIYQIKSIKNKNEVPLQTFCFLKFQSTPLKHFNV